MSHVRQFFGWPVPERLSFRFRVEQGIVGFNYIEAGNRTTTRWYVAKRPEIMIASSGIGTKVTRTNRESEIVLRPDLMAEHITTIALLSNRFLGCEPVLNDLLIDHVGSTKAIRLDPLGGAPLYLWTTEVGGIVTASIRAGDRVVTLTPLAYTVLPDGSRFVTIWKRDAEPPMRVVGVELNGHVYEGELGADVA